MSTEPNNKNKILYTASNYPLIYRQPSLLFIRKPNHASRY
ncbi:hypothetical protein K661_02739 [Piscirickettsia salmonis LF-89 = ATCC VR-1361]|nr:hypothetical protein K661_02739 [Piscirickettsia salmonis LF-89 = ATCC VR-1361]